MGQNFTSILRHAKCMAHQVLRCRSTETDDQLRLNYRDLGLQPGTACSDLNSVWFAVDASLASFDELEVFNGVGHVDPAAIDAGLLERLIQQAAGRTNERFALHVFLIARLLANHHYGRMRRALAEHSLGGVTEQVAALAILRGSL